MFKGTNLINVSVVISDATEKCRFVIEIPTYLIKNENFLEVMEGYRLSDPVGWLEGLTYFIRQTIKESQNGQDCN